MTFSKSALKFRQKNLLIACKWDKLFKNGPSKICGRQPLKSLNRYVCIHFVEIFHFLEITLLLYVIVMLEEKY